MKITIAYAGKTGTTQQAAAELAQLLTARGATVALCNLATQKPDLTADAFAVGGSVRIGRWHRRSVAFVNKNIAGLLAKPLALFACRCGQDDLRVLLAKQLGDEIVSHAVYVDRLGGAMEPAKQKGFDHFVVRMIQKSDPTTTNLDAPGMLTEHIAACADALMGATQA